MLCPAASAHLLTASSGSLLAPCQLVLLPARPLRATYYVPYPVVGDGACHSGHSMYIHLPDLPCELFPLEHDLPDRIYLAPLLVLPSLPSLSDLSMAPTIPAAYWPLGQVPYVQHFLFHILQLRVDLFALYITQHNMILQQPLLSMQAERGRERERERERPTERERESTKTNKKKGKGGMCLAHASPLLFFFF